MRRSMADALAESVTQETQSVEDKEALLALKRQAVESPQVKDFIKRGPTPEAVKEEPLKEDAPFDPREMVQLNVKVPMSLVARLKRAAFEQQMSGQKSVSMQTLVFDALSAELRRLGF